MLFVKFGPWPYQNRPWISVASLLLPVLWLKYDVVSIRNVAAFDGLYIKLFFKEILAATEITVLKTERVRALLNFVGYLSCQNKYLLLVFFTQQNRLLVGSQLRKVQF